MEDAGQGQTDAGQADWADAGQADQVDSGNQGNPEQQEGLAAGEEVAGGEAEAEDPVRIALKEYFCDGYSLYLSFEVTSEEPFLDFAGMVSPDSLLWGHTFYLMVASPPHLPRHCYVE